MAQVTLIGNRIATPGQPFVFRGPGRECRECGLKTACLQLEAGRLYRVVKARDVHHEDGCVYHEEGVRVVEVELSPVAASLRRPLAMEGSLIDYARPVCSNHECQHYDLCHPTGLEGPDRVKVERVGERLECPLGYDLQAAEVSYA